MQNRLMLPAWLGVGTALRAVMETGGTDDLREMARDWPFFKGWVVSCQEGTEVAREGWHLHRPLP